MSFVECRDLAKTYRRGEQAITPLEGVDLELDAGDFLALMGPSGSGKTTLLNLLGGIDQPTRGALTIGGTPLHGLKRSALADWRARTVGHIFQLYHLVPVLTAYENVELPLFLRAMTRRERHRRVADALETVGLADRHDHLPRQLSGGQEQRVAIARAIVNDAPLLLGDEPTGDLDRENAEAVMDLLTRLNQAQRRTIVLVTHDPKVAARASRILHLEKGRLASEEASR